MRYLVSFCRVGKREEGGQEKSAKVSKGFTTFLSFQPRSATERAAGKSMVEGFASPTPPT